jgi:hypothetical protein
MTTKVVGAGGIRAYDLTGKALLRWRKPFADDFAWDVTATAASAEERPLQERHRLFILVSAIAPTHSRNGGLGSYIDGRSAMEMVQEHRNDQLPEP